MSPDLTACPRCGALGWVDPCSACADLSAETIAAAIGEPNTEPPCLNGDHEPNDDGSACYYCGLSAEVITDADELAADLWNAYSVAVERVRDRAQEARTGARVIRQSAALRMWGTIGQAFALDTARDLGAFVPGAADAIPGGHR